MPLKCIKLLLIFILFVFLSPSIFVEAHSSLVKTQPQGGERSTQSPKTIEFWFKDPVVIHSNSIKVTDTKGNKIQLSNIYADLSDKGHVIGELEGILPAGIYIVDVQVIALDGDPLKEKFTFEIIEENLEDKKSEPLKLLKQSPSDGEIVKGNVEKIDLWFNQPVELTAIGIFNERSYALKQPLQDPSNPNHLIIELNESLNKGTYQVTWYGHPEGTNQPDHVDVFYFAVDEFTPLKENAMGTPLKKVPYINNIGLKQLGYWFFFIGITLLFGLSFFSKMILKDQNRNLRQQRVSWFLFLVSLVGILFMVIQQRIAFTEISPKEFISLKMIFIPIIQLVFLLIGLFIKRMEVLSFTIALLLTPFTMGHASYPRYGGVLTIILNELHVIAASVWLGGLLALLLYSKKEEFSEWLEKVGVRFSNWALPSLLIVILTGILMTFQYIPSFTFESFYKSSWGKSILYKLGLTILIGIIGYSQRRALRQLTVSVVIRFKRRGRSELLYGLFVLFFASMLMVSTPSAAEQGVYPLGQEPSDKVNIHVSPFEPGLNVIQFDFQTHREVESVMVKISMPPQYKVDYNAFKLDNNKFAITGNVFHAAGTLLMEVTAKMKTGEEEVYQYSVIVPGESRFNE
ncbi:copper resistance protein CopC [Bacillus salitolerans]|uniref:Copper resistance protein CopC n=1 Tax=Bacillus salitolerans TaxID=1437434 RepID=A0ABW4LNH3_9BACI